MTTRRTFIAGLLAAGTAPRLGWAAAGNPSYLAAAREADGAHALFGLDRAGGETFRVPLPARGHAGAGHPLRPEAVAFARRPGGFALVIDCAGGTATRRLDPPDGRQFNGHGCYSADGSWLMTSEQHSDSSAGVVGVWDVARGYARIGEFASGGIGPHDLRLMPDGQGLVIANGGIATDPTDRTKLNIDTMQPNLTYLDLGGSILEQVRLPDDLARNSIRHLALRGDGLVAFAMQWEGDADDAPPLVGLHRRGDAPVLAGAPLAAERAMQGYAGSIAFAGGGAELAITSPRGGRLHRFSDTGMFLGAVSRTDICGLAGHDDGFIASDGLGGIIAVRGGKPTPLARHGRAWDNHIVRLDG